MPVKPLGRIAPVVAWWSGPPTGLLRLGVLVAYTVAIAVGVATHEMWRDELQAWLIVRDSPTLAALFGHLHYEGHPALWYLWLWPLVKSGAAPQLMPWAHAALAVAGIAVLLWRAPLTRLETMLVPFGYSLLFEFGVKSRSYMLGALLMFLVCTFWDDRRRPSVRLTAALALLTNVHALFTVTAGALVLAIAVDRLRDAHVPSFTGRDAAALLVVGLAALAAVITAHPPADSQYVSWWDEQIPDRLVRTLGLFAGMLALGGPALSAIGAACFLLLCRQVSRSPAALTLLVVSALGMLCVFHVLYPGYAWHHGVLVVSTVCAVWIARGSDTAELDGRGVGTAATHPRAQGALLPILVGQALVGMAALADDVRLPYSQSMATAQWLTAHGLRNVPIVADNDFIAVPVIGYLNIPSMYTPRGDRWFSYIRVDQQRRQRRMPEAIARLGAMHPAPTILMSPSAAAADPWPTRLGYVEVVRFVGPPIAAWAHATREEYVIYRPAPHGAR